MHITVPNALLPLKLFVDVLDDIGEECSRTGCRVEYLDFVYLFFDALVPIFVAPVSAL